MRLTITFRRRLCSGRALPVHINVSYVYATHTLAASKRSSAQRMTPLSPSSSIYHSLIPPSSPAVATTRLVIRNYSRDGEARFSKRMDRLTEKLYCCWNLSFPWDDAMCWHYEFFIDKYHFSSYEKQRRITYIVKVLRTNFLENLFGGN